MKKIMLAAILIASAFATTAAFAQSTSIQIEQPFSRATPGGAKVGGGYLTIVNKGSAADKLVAASSPASERVEIHEMKMEGGVMKMQEVAGGLAVDAGKSVALAPGGYHLMLMGLKAPLKEGDKVPVTLTFEKAGKVDATLDVRGIGGQTAPKMAPMNHGH